MEVLFTVLLHILGILGATALLLVLAYSCVVLYGRMKVAHLPGPSPPSFFLGHVPTMKANLKRNEFDQLLYQKWAAEFGDVYKMQVSFIHMIVVLRKEIIKELLTNSKYPKSKLVEDSIFHTLGQRVIGRGLLANSDHEKWYKRRSTIDPFFHRKCLKVFMMQFNETGDHLVEKLSTFADGKSYINLADYLGRFTLDVIGKVGFNFDISSIENDQDPFPNALTRVLEGIHVQYRDPFANIKPSLASLRKKVGEAGSLLRSKGREVLEARMKDIQEGNDVPKDLLTGILTYLQADSSLNMEDALDDFCTLFIAGQETTANTLAFLLLIVGRHPDVYQRLVEEVKSTLDGAQEVTFDHLGQLTYMGQVIKETLRLYPVAPGTARTVTTDTFIQGIKFPKGALIVIPFYVLHRLPQYFPDPEEFKPERFDPDQPRPMYTYIPFSLGQRSCVGQQFAIMETKVMLCKLLQQFHFEVDPTHKLEIEEKFTLRPKGGCPVILTPRED